jgi:putative oxidoreductase
MATYDSLSRRVSTVSPYLLSVLRIVLALLFIEHGSMKLFHFPYSDDFKDLKLFSLEGVAGVLEFLGGLFLLVGFRTRVVAFLLSGLMACAYFIAHAPHGFFPALNMGEAAVIYSFLFLYLAAAGGGPLSIDAVLAGVSALKPRTAHDMRPYPAQ